MLYTGPPVLEDVRQWFMESDRVTAKKYICVSLVTIICGAMACASTSMAASEKMSCATFEAIESICNLQAPEDLVVAPNGRDIIFSQFADNGSIAVLDTHNHSVHSLYPGSDSTLAQSEFWGDASCRQPPAVLLPHGIDLSQRLGGQWQLLVVNHGGRESVEFFEVEFAQDERPRLTWRGCAVAPDQGSFNDVSATPDDGFLVSNTGDMDRQMWQLVLLQFGVDSGYIYRWQAASGFSKVEGTDGEMPNGVIVSPDGKSFYVNMYFGNEIRRYDLASGELLQTNEVDKPDNLSWTDDGRLLLASQHSSLLPLLKSVFYKTPEPSLLPFSIYELDPVTLKKTLLVRRDGPPMGAGTTAVAVDGFLYIGSYAGDRMIKLPIVRDKQ
jgi:hypothetical protein